MIVLGIETSCDETGVAICDNSKIIASYTKTQSIHTKFGGVVPEIASREHEKFLPEITEKVLKDSKLQYSDLEAIAVTSGPGLMGSLLSGISFAKGISQGLDIPIIPINHLEAHLNSAFIEFEALDPPFINLLVSGGHTQIWLVKDLFEYTLLGETLDDACGEAFDKGAKTLGLNYPGGPEIEKLAMKGDRELINFPRPIINDGTYNFSFSGLKTSLINCVNKDKYNLSDVAASYQEAIVDCLLGKLKNSMDDLNINIGIVCGGVAANQRLREKLNALDKTIIFPSLKYCTDNADMIAFLGEKKINNNSAKIGINFSAYSRGMIV
ncbi:MAG: tRNA (adenosine(37)-N6)-threonylcarbamoyltransferase complex transferase subunit TsaD [Candidatus Marinimicrobia bacterium]|nr:tRNA (adenosine(37)-N6)-threonylcarbamoyltransferase complex transferase subunit TsaD [Gammaproteobacteria bacterium]MBL6911589.1 tRNA (adenosine(37)-N6)-threonylcarbamoyltransferase complex transferase subunit TsaD [Candidatus Neomarinimicrobiota bacterium]MBT3727673.1 tRNA (adenosine(37)-N6)-threonylcarbamoyltransferase complex transferase subunit TsaD [Candidatus Neomarinimicrobiota bacterium]MBT3944702.1 tRNA (adenosine(37)-N6)-threonylcarbamoyltransferase complex transferase subunit TsaD